MTIETNRTYFYAPHGSQQPVAITVMECDEQAVTYLADGLGTNPYRQYAEPRWMVEQAVLRGEAAARALLCATLDTNPLTAQHALLAARFIAVLDHQQPLRQEQADRVGHRVRWQNKEGIIIFAHRQADVWLYRVWFLRERAADTLRRDTFEHLDESLPLDTLPPAPPVEVESQQETEDEPPLPPEAAVIHQKMVKDLKARAGDDGADRVAAWAERHESALRLFAGALAQTELAEAFLTRTPPPSAPPVHDLGSIQPPPRPASVGEFRGHPVLRLALDEKDKEWSFGRTKARSILANLEAIAAFAREETTESEQKPTETGEKTNENPPDGSKKA